MGFGLPAFGQPVGTPTTINANEDDLPVTVDLTTVFSGGVPTETYSIVTNSNAGLVSTSLAANILTLTLQPDGNGTATITVQDTDGDVPPNNVATADITVVVAAVNDPPTAIGQSVTVAEDNSVAITLTGSDPEGSALTYNVVTPPTNGTLSGTAPNLTYTPGANFNGTDSFAFTV
ncbi:MAG TPA: Ig-like domain-containing protein, partial [Pseudomonadales bacterium]|nr:Ig-like domain-containing protein [Pseudomonadales bacterium]